MYGVVNAVDLYVGLFLQKNYPDFIFPLTRMALGAPYSIRRLLMNLGSSPEYLKPSTFGGDVGC